jgi:prepilin-type processing-associated H-X9-DG protein
MLLGALGKAKTRATRAACLSNLRETGIGFTLFANEHNSAFPMDVPAAAGGARDYRPVVPAGQFLADFPQAFSSLSNELVNPKILICPADSRLPAVNFAQFTDTNLSFYAGLQTSFSLPASVLAADRNVIYGNDGEISWNAQLHGNQGNILLADGHVEERKHWISPIAIPTTTGSPTGGGGGGGGGRGPVNSPPSVGGTPRTPKLGDIVDPSPDQSTAQSPTQLPGNPTSQPMSKAASTQRALSSANSQRPGKSPSAFSDIGNSPSRGAVSTNVAGSAATGPDSSEHISWLMRLAQWAILAGSLVSLTIALIILLLMLLKSMRDRRLKRLSPDTPSEEP